MPSRRWRARVRHETYFLNVLLPGYLSLLSPSPNASSPSHYLNSLPLYLSNLSHLPSTSLLPQSLLLKPQLVVLLLWFEYDLSSPKLIMKYDCPLAILGGTAFKR
jgi:hypothetical protein